MTEKHILLIHTGGTISMKENASAGSVGPHGGNPIADVSEIPGVDAFFTVKEPFQIPSPHMTISEMIILKELIEQTEADGVVVTHGTDTLEETAYFLDLTLSRSIPVVVTGAMRSSNEIGADGLPNLIAAVKTVIHDESVGKGVMVVMNETIHSARYVTKANTGNLSAFQSLDAGPIGVVLKSGAHFYSTPAPLETFDIRKVDLTIPVLTAYAGMDSFLLNQLSSCDGVVIEALGQGNLPPAAAQAVRQLIKSGVPVVIASRCASGIVQPAYSYEGGGRTLKEAGALFSSGLNGPKARLKLFAALSAGRKKDLPSLFA
ncbi:L-asparaginase [Domibacillus antri]|uniref:asparaginase n=1 Tax=Domibacillus antri TaxID=1714264 RepID=A0A1Q8Q7E6_9BACI|nr:asparaginase [Domibacillus antri]OLN23259.1 L-asparaginase [Domibacillus antri]